MSGNGRTLWGSLKSVRERMYSFVRKSKTSTAGSSSDVAKSRFPLRSTPKWSHFRTPGTVIVCANRSGAFSWAGDEIAQETIATRMSRSFLIWHPQTNQLRFHRWPREFISRDKCRLAATVRRGALILERQPEGLL